MIKNIFKYDTYKINAQWNTECYYHDSFDSFLRDNYNIAESTYIKYLRLQENYMKINNITYNSSFKTYKIKNNFFRSLKEVNEFLNK